MLAMGCASPGRVRSSVQLQLVVLGAGARRESSASLATWLMASGHLVVMGSSGQTGSPLSMRSELIVG